MSTRDWIIGTRRLKPFLDFEMRDYLQLEYVQKAAMYRKQQWRRLN
jgi:hypothetical protein